ncbi:DUF1707 SHOCT-like domain-containing protein [Pseudonocardia sp. CA-107938]|uniref:DUF1707 SHOCT-like domain-containing protein n=1 Tax=Pseudonocardia sp. CA-107938 TaxID=3240021 RepID=UPI003D8C24D9
MTEGTGPADAVPMRIGNAERNAAMKALDEHLNAGRLGVEEYADRTAAAAGATVASELQALFTDLPAPHPDLGGTVDLVKPAAAPATRDAGTVAHRSPNLLETWGGRVVAVTPIVALALFFITGHWWFFLLIPAIGALVYGGHHDRDDRRRDRRR